MKMNAQSVGTVLLVVGAVIIGVFGVNPDNNQEGANAIKPAKQTVLTQEEVKRIGHTSKPVAAGSLPRARTTRLPIFHTKASPFAAASPSSAPKVVGQAAPTVAAEEAKQSAATVLLEEKAIEQKVGNDLGVQLPFLMATLGYSAFTPSSGVARTLPIALHHPASLSSGGSVSVKMAEKDYSRITDRILKNQVGKQTDIGSRWPDLRVGMAEVDTEWLRSLDMTQAWDAKALLDADALDAKITRLEEVVYEMRRIEEGVYKEMDDPLYDKNWAPALVDQALTLSLTQLEILQHYRSAAKLQLEMLQTFPSSQSKAWDAEAFMDADALDAEITRLEEVVHETRRIKKGAYKVDDELYDKALQQSSTQLEILQHYSSARQLAQALQHHPLHIFAVHTIPWTFPSSQTKAGKVEIPSKAVDKNTDEPPALF